MIRFLKDEELNDLAKDAVIVFDPEIDQGGIGEYVSFLAFARFGIIPSTGQIVTVFLKSKVMWESKKEFNLGDNK